MVYVDRTKVALSQRPVEASPLVVGTQRLVAPIESSLVLKGLSPTVYNKKELQQREARIQRILKRNRDEAFQNLRDALIRSFERVLEREASEKRSELTEKRMKLMDESALRIDRLFVDYANQRGPLVNDLALIVGYPIPRREQLERPPDDQVWERNQYEKALKLYAQISQVEQAYGALIGQEKDRLLAEASNMEGSVGAEIARLKQVYAESAMAIAQEQMVKAEREQTLTLDPAEGAQQPALNEKRSRVGFPGQILQGPSAEPSGQLLPDEAARLEEDLKLWADQRGYRLMEKPGRYPDETESFLKWRQQLHPGP